MRQNQRFHLLYRRTKATLFNCEFYNIPYLVSKLYGLGRLCLLTCVAMTHRLSLTRVTLALMSYYVVIRSNNDNGNNNTIISAIIIINNTVGAHARKH